MITFGQYIRQNRDEHDISLRDFAKKIECSPAFVSDIELGKRNPSEEVFAKIAKAFGVSVNQLKQYDTRPPIEDLRKKLSSVSDSDPGLAFAFRTIIDKNINSKDLLKFAESHSKKTKRK